MKIKLTLSYDGTAYSGWQKQKNGCAVQEVLENAVFALTGERTSVIGSGRTDAGVHAAGQVAHFRTNSAIPPERFYLALNPLLPDDVKVIDSCAVDEDFHSVRSAKRKTYVYSVYFSRVPLPLKERYALRVDGKVDLLKMRECARLFCGEHDFKAFSSVGSSVKTTVREIYSLEVVEEEGGLKFFVTGNGFLYNMVRIIAGTLLAVGFGSLLIDDVREAFSTGNRSKAGKTLPAKGLTLSSVEYV